MAIRKWRFVVAFLMLCLFASVFLWPEAGRRIALATQFSSHITHIGGKLLLAGATLVATVLLGRVYCSLLCPAGLVQELFHRVGGMLKLRRLRYAGRARPILLLAAVGAATAFGLMTLANFLDPLGLFGRAALALSPAGPAATAATVILGAFLLILVPLFKGRWFCDRLCPVGALLGLAASAGTRGVALDAEKCVSCGRCETICPVRAVDAIGKRLDADRCVLCLDCVGKCPVDALSYRRREPEARRGFLRTLGAATAGGLFVLGRPIAAEMGSFSGGVPDIAPPGAGGDDRHRARCISCQSCVPACPVGIIRPGADDLRPVLDYDYGYCQYGCVACTESCPAGALFPLSVEEKQRTRLARVELEYDRCVAVVSGMSCGACAEVCPTHAVRMVDSGMEFLTVPDFDAAHCIGCGACYHVCPSEPRAFVVQGLRVHETSLGVRPGGHADDNGGSAPADGDDWEAQEFPF